MSEQIQQQRLDALSFQNVLTQNLITTMGGTSAAVAANTAVLNKLNSGILTLAAGIETLAGTITQSFAAQTAALVGDSRHSGRFNGILRTSRAEFGKSFAKIMGDEQLFKGFGRTIQRGFGGALLSRRDPGGMLRGAIQGAAGMSSGSAKNQFQVYKGFGAMAKDVGKTGAGKFNAASKAAKQMGLSMVKMAVFQKPMQAFWKGFLEPLEPLADLMGALGESLMPLLIPFMEELIQIFIDDLLPVMPELVENLLPLALAFAKLAPAFIVLLIALIPVVGPLILIFTAITMLLEAITPENATSISDMSGALTGILGTVTILGSPLQSADGLLINISTTFTSLITPLTTASNLLGGLSTSLINIISPLQIIQSIASGISGEGSALTSIGGRIIDGAGNLIGLNGALRRI